MKFHIVAKEEKENLRRKFIDKFIDTKTEHYKKHIATLKEYPDGLCYDGYLWDSLKVDYNEIERTMEQAIEYLKSKNNVFVMWDIYSKHRVIDNSTLSNDYPKGTVIRVDSLELCQFIQREWGDYSTSEKYLPEDIYIYDNTMDWYIIFTHEGYDNSSKPELSENDYIRICFVYQSIR